MWNPLIFQSPLHEVDLTLTLTLEDPSTEALLLAAMNATSLDEIYNGAAANLCPALHDLIMGGGLRSLSVDWSKTQLLVGAKAPAWELDGATDSANGLVNGVLALLTTAYDAHTLSGAANGLLGTLVRPAVNSKVSELIESWRAVGCPSPSPPPVDAMPWAKTEIGVLSSLVSTKTEAAVLDAVIDTLTHGTGQFMLPKKMDPINIKLPFHLGHVTISPHPVGIGGLNTASMVDAISPATNDPYALHRYYGALRT